LGGLLAEQVHLDDLAARLPAPGFCLRLGRGPRRFGPGRPGLLRQSLPPHAPGDC